MRYILNEELLKKAKPNGRYYTDLKCIKSAALTAFAGIVQSAKLYIKLNGIKLKNGNVEMINEALRKFNKTVLKNFVYL